MDVFPACRYKYRDDAFCLDKVQGLSQYGHYAGSNSLWFPRRCADSLSPCCVPEVINLLLHRSFSSCCSSRASAWPRRRAFLPLLHLPTSLLTHVSVILRLRPTLFSSTVLSMLSHRSSLLLSRLLPHSSRGSVMRGHLVAWLLGYSVTDYDGNVEEKKN